MTSFEKPPEASPSPHKAPASFKHKIFNRSNRHIIVLLAAFAGVLSIVALVTWYGLFNFKAVQVKFENIVDNHMAKLILTQRMAATARQRILTMHKMTELADPFDRDEEALKLNTLSSQFAQARIKLIQLGLMSNEQALLDEQGKRTAVAVPVQLEIVDLLANDQLQLARNKLIFEASPAQDKVMEVLEDISQSQILAANRASVEARDIYQATLNGMLMMSAGAFLIGSIIIGLVTTWAYRSTIEREKHLYDLEHINRAYEKKARELAIATEQANIASETKSAFLANMSHEIRTPLTAIIGFADDLLDHYDTENQDYKSIETISRNGKHLLHIINEILDISKIESGKLEIERLKVSLFDLLHDIHALLKLQAEEKGLKLLIDFAFPLPAHIHTDPTRLKQILLNLCYNAIKFTNKGTVSVQVLISADNRQLQFVVKDTGIGMTESQLNKIFDTFAQGDSSTTREYGGTGLGLCISRYLAEMLGGSIKAESGAGVGSAFTLCIDPGPLDSADFISQSPTLESRLNAAEENIIPRLSGRILLAEDTPDNQQLISLLIKKTGADVDIAENGLLAVEKASNNQFDLVLMDMQMPKLDGIEATRQLRDIGMLTPIVALTANARSEDIDNCKYAGADDFLSKPIDRAAFYAVLKQHLQPVTKSENQQQETLDTALNDIRQRFIERLPEWLETIKAAIADNDTEHTARLLHEMKGLGGSFGFPVLTSMSRQLEELLKSTSTDHFNTDFSLLEDEIKQIISS